MVPRYKTRHPIVYLLLCSSISSITVVASRAFSSILTDVMGGQVMHLAVCALCADACLRLLHAPPVLVYISPQAPITDLIDWVPAIALLIIIITAVSSTYYLQRAMGLFPNNQARTPLHRFAPLCTTSHPSAPPRTPLHRLAPLCTASHPAHRHPDFARS